MGYKPTGRNHAAASRPQLPADREAYRRRGADPWADAVAARLDHGQQMDELAVEIRRHMEQLRQCRTPAERAQIEAQVRPLVRQRRSLGSWAN